MSLATCIQGHSHEYGKSCEQCARGVSEGYCSEHRVLYVGGCVHCMGATMPSQAVVTDAMYADPKLRRPGELFDRFSRAGLAQCVACGDYSTPRTCHACGTNPSRALDGFACTGAQPVFPIVFGEGPGSDRVDNVRLRTENDTLRLQNEQLTKDCRSIAQNCASLGALNKDLLSQLDGSASSHSRVSDLKGDVVRLTEEKADLVAAVRVKDREIERLKEAARRRR